MRLVFADTLYWGAILHPLDQYRAQVIRVREALGEIRLVTTDEVLTELLDGLAERGPHLRGAAARAIRTIMSDRASDGPSAIACVLSSGLAFVRAT